MKRRNIWIGSAALLAVAISWALAAGGASGESAYRFVEVTRGDIEATVTATGTLQATETVEVGTQVSGLIAKIYVDFNDRVEEGDLLATIDPTILEQTVRSAEVGLTRRQAELDQAQREAERAEQLYGMDVISQQDLEVERYQLVLAEVNYRDAAIDLERARRNLQYSEIRAPIGGVVIARNVEVGQTVAASLSAPVLFVLAQDLSEMEILASVDESDVGLIKQGQDVHFGVQAYGNRSFSGRVEQVRLQASSQDNVVTYGVVVSVANQDGVLLPGMTATLAVVIERLEDALTVSNTALRFRPTEEMAKAMKDQLDTTATGRRGRSGSPGDGAARRGVGAGDRQGAGVRAGGAGSQRGASGRTGVATLWFENGNGDLETARVRTGLTDGVRTAITSPGDIIQPGLMVIAAVTTASAAEQAAENPFLSREAPTRGRGGPR